MSDGAVRFSLIKQFQAVELKKYEACERTFSAFFRCAWKIIEPSTPLLFNWHHALIAEYLTACYLGQIKRLIINIPPRYSKSTLATIAFPVWVWIQDPAKRFLVASYSGGLSLKHSIDRRRIIESEWFRRRWGEKVKIMWDQAAKGEFTNTARGHMTATSLSGTVTGKGGNYLIIDDPHNPKRAESNTERATDLDAYDLTLSTRLDDKKRDVIIVIMQRLHQADLSGHLLERGNEWTNLRIPAVEDRPGATYVFPISGKVKRREVGEILHPEREGVAEIEAAQVSLGSYGFAGQYQQRPAPRGGGMLKEDNWLYYDELPADLAEWLTSWDCSFKEAESSDYVAGIVFARVGCRKYIVDMFHKKVGFADTLRAIKEQKKKYPKIRRILVEETANGVAVIEMLKKELSGVTAIRATRSKTERVATVEPDHEQRNYLLPNPEKNPWVKTFKNEVSLFPASANDDIVDAFSQGANWFLEHEGRGIDALIQM